MVLAFAPTTGHAEGGILGQSVRSLVGPRVTTPQVDSLIPTRIPGFELRVLNAQKQVRVNLNADGRLGKDIWVEHMLPIYIYYPVEPVESILGGSSAIPSAQSLSGPSAMDNSKVKELEERIRAMDGVKKLDASVRLKKLDQMEQLLVSAAATTPGDQSDFDRILHIIRELKILDGQADVQPKDEPVTDKKGKSQSANGKKAPGA
jgi:hypothetical protein